MQLRMNEHAGVSFAQSVLPLIVNPVRVPGDRAESKQLYGARPSAQLREPNADLDIFEAKAWNDHRSASDEGLDARYERFAARIGIGAADGKEHERPRASFAKPDVR